MFKQNFKKAKINHVLIKLDIEVIFTVLVARCQDKFITVTKGWITRLIKVYNLRLNILYFILILEIVLLVWDILDTAFFFNSSYLFNIKSLIYIYYIL